MMNRNESHTAANTRKKNQLLVVITTMNTHTHTHTLTHTVTHALMMNKKEKENNHNSMITRLDTNLVDTTSSFFLPETTKER